ncbi:MAG TPA: SRPBCC domain-containing protein [Kofleriaceae bacterium]|nr:SRPBCC domain-containing protein [Kofleriaceae bacterium]
MKDGSPDVRATKKAGAFRMECAVAITIQAPAQRIWSLLTSASDFPRWNSTVESIEGEIAPGQKLRIRVPIAPGRTFKPRVTEMEPEKRMVWSDGAPPMFRGVRTFRLTPRSDGSTEFSMVEVLSGLMLPLIRRSLPDFGPPFERYAADLKREAER